MDRYRKRGKREVSVNKQKRESEVRREEKRRNGTNRMKRGDGRKGKS